MFDFFSDPDNAPELTHEPRAAWTPTWRVLTTKRRVTKTNRRKIDSDWNMLPVDGIVSEEFEFRAHDGLRLRGAWFGRSPHAEGTITLIQARGSHTGKYQSLANALVRLGFQVVTFDLRSQGRSDGEATDPSLVHLNDVLEYLNDNSIFLKEIVKPDLRGVHVLAGHSLGAALAILYAASEDKPLPADFLVVAAPMIKGLREPHDRQKQLIRLAGSTLGLVRRTRIGGVDSDGIGITLGWGRVYCQIQDRLGSLADGSLDLIVKAIFGEKDGVVSTRDAMAYLSNKARHFSPHADCLTLPDADHSFNDGHPALMERIARVAAGFLPGGRTMPLDPSYHQRTPHPTRQP